MNGKKPSAMYSQTCAMCQAFGSNDKSEYTWNEQFANIVSHAVPAIISILLTLHTYNQAAPQESTYVLIYGVGITICFICSSIYHVAGIMKSEWVPFFLMFDYSAIFVNIAASFTPWTKMALAEHVVGTLVFYVVWLMAAFGIYNVFFKHFPKTKPETLYPVMVSFSLLLIYPLYLSDINYQAIAWMAVGLFWFIVGFVCFVKEKKISYGHALFHTLVAVGNFTHWYGIYNHVIYDN
ncbi:hypothetical protein AKO1_010197 [Acrasis kona]|uniref:Hemolysin III n=1 Tax=Acrasis kona TaxID=1008807 RepID=A0AAW2ZSP5_9EUKA